MKKIAYILLTLNLCFSLKVYGTEMVYINIFEGVTVLPTECYFDAKHIENGASFSCKSGRVAMGNLPELKDDFNKYVKKTTKSNSNHFGLNITKFGPPELDSYLVKDKKQYIIFATGDDRIYKLSMAIYCKNLESKRNEKSNK